MSMTLRVRWLGRVAYSDGDALQRGLHEHGRDDYLLLLEHPHVYTLGTTSHLEHVLTPPASELRKEMRDQTRWLTGVVLVAMTLVATIVRLT